MKQVRGFWLPDGETHLVPFLKRDPEYAGGPTYQLHKYLACKPHIRKFGHAVDVGAHCGLWSRVFAHDFTKVTAFEPVADHRRCFVSNIPRLGLTPLGNGVLLYPYALGDRAGDISLHTGPSSSGDTYVQKDGEHSALMERLDNLGLTPIDFLKIDCEGYEKFVLLGGEQTVRRDKPCVIVEQKPGKAAQFGLGDTEAVDLLKSWGATLHQVIKGDYIFSWV